MEIPPGHSGRHPLAHGQWSHIAPREQGLGLGWQWQAVLGRNLAGLLVPKGTGEPRIYTRLPSTCLFILISETTFFTLANENPIHFVSIIEPIAGKSAHSGWPVGAIGHCLGERVRTRVPGGAWQSETSDRGETLGMLLLLFCSTIKWGSGNQCLLSSLQDHDEWIRSLIFRSEKAWILMANSITSCVTQVSYPTSPNFCILICKTKVITIT